MSVFDPERKTGLGSSDGRRTSEQEDPGDREAAGMMLALVGVVLAILAIAELLR